ncbi:MAG: helicase RepA family protein [Phycisphaerales bacterium]|nr:helicase RepA family protein [Phycisphaerales bacterium]
MASYMNFRLIILDAFYRFLPRDTDENDNGAMAQLYNLVDRYADETGAAFVLIHHTSKGDQSGKSITDLGSGAGAQSRAPDAHIGLRYHEEDDAVVMEASVRNWPPPAPLCLRWQYPIWIPDPTLDPAALRSPGSRKRKIDEDAAVVADRIEHFSCGLGVMTCAGSESQSPALPCGAPKRYGRVKKALIQLKRYFFCHDHLLRS